MGQQQGATVLFFLLFGEFHVMYSSSVEYQKCFAVWYQIQTASGQLAALKCSQVGVWICHLRLNICLLLSIHNCTSSVYWACHLTGMAASHWYMCFSIRPFPFMLVDESYNIDSSSCLLAIFSLMQQCLWCLYFMQSIKIRSLFSYLNVLILYFYQRLLLCTFYRGLLTNYSNVSILLKIH